MVTIADEEAKEAALNITTEDLNRKVVWMFWYWCSMRFIWEKTSIAHMMHINISTVFKYEYTRIHLRIQSTIYKKYQVFARCYARLYTVR